MNGIKNLKDVFNKAGIDELQYSSHKQPLHISWYCHSGMLLLQFVQMDNLLNWIGVIMAQHLD